jgi:ketosteroid isomerase-like protein
MRKLLDNIGKQLYITVEPLIGRHAVSSENVALVRSIYDNFAKGEIQSVLAALDPDVEWIESDLHVLPHRGTHRGPSSVATGVFGQVMTSFEEFAVVPERIHDAGDTVVVEGRAVGRTKGGRVLDAPAAWVWTVRDGKATRNVNYHDTDAWRQALGKEL